ncbi:MAG: TolC family protein [Acidobacteriota bacterium]
MTRNRGIWLGLMLVAALTAGTADAAQQTSDARLHELVRQASDRVAAGQTATPAPQTAAGQAAAGARPTLSLTLDDVVKAALDHNLNIAVQRLNPQIQDISLASLRSIYKPLLGGTLGTQSLDTPSTQTISGGVAGDAINRTTTTFSATLQQSVPVAGGSFLVNLSNQRLTTNSTTATFVPQYTPTWTAQYTQPLFRGRIIDSNRQAMLVTRLNRDISDVQLRSTITNTLSNVRVAYWNYVFAVQSVEVARQSVALAQQLVQDNQTRVQVGTMAPLDVVTAQSQAATAQQALVAAQSTMRTAELALKQLIVSGTEDPVWNATIDPVDRPDFRPEPIDLEAAVRRALNERTDLAIAKKNLQQNDATVKYLRDQLLPQADLVASYGFTGLGGTFQQFSGTGLPGSPRVVTDTIPGGYTDALSTLFHGKYPQWTVQMNLSYPLGLSAAQATVARARVQQSQDQAQVKVIELQVATDVTNAVVTTQSNVERVQAAQAARTLAQQALDAEQAKFQVGMSTNYLVIQQQNALSTAQNNELQAILNYRNSLVELERLQQTTLTSLGITIVSSATR